MLPTFEEKRVVEVTSRESVIRRFAAGTAFQSPSERRRMGDVQEQG